MPQTTPERRARWKTDANAIKFLEDLGYELTPQWEWLVPDKMIKVPTTPEEKAVKKKAVDAILYLIQEWDFGGIVHNYTLVMEG